MAKLQLGDIVLIHPYCNPEGKVGKVIHYTPGVMSMFGYDYYTITYLFKPDNFGRTSITHQADDPNFKIINTIDIKSLEVLYG